MRVSVVGAGVGGLAAAIGLQRAGAAVTVFERASELVSSGSGLSVFPNGVAALDALGIGQEFRSISTGDGELLRAGQRRPDGRWLATIPREAVSGLRVVHRTDLHDLLAGSLEAGTVRLATSVTRVSEDGTRLWVRDGTSQTEVVSDLIVAADGIRSRTRAGWPGDPGLRYSGYAAWRGVTQRPVDLRGEAGETWGHGLRFGMAPLPDSRVYWFAAATMPADAEFRNEAERVRELFGRWHDPIPQLLDATDPATVFRLPIHDLADPIRSFRRARAVLLGDAAHAMTPDLGQGGGQALEDSATLTVLLGPLAAADAVDDEAIDRALADYDRLRRPRTQRIALASRRVGALAHVRGAFAVAIRDLAMRATPSAVLRRQALSVQEWQAPPSA